MNWQPRANLRVIREKMDDITVRIKNRSNQIQTLEAGVEAKPKALQATVEDLIPDEDLILGEVSS